MNLKLRLGSTAMEHNLILLARRWLASHDAKAIAEAIAPDFPDIDRTILERAGDRFSRQGTWARDPILRQPGFDYLQEILQTDAFIRKRHRYEDLVDPRSPNGPSRK